MRTLMRMAESAVLSDVAGREEGEAAGWLINAADNRNRPVDILTYSNDDPPLSLQNGMIWNSFGLHDGRLVAAYNHLSFRATVGSVGGG